MNLLVVTVFSTAEVRTRNGLGIYYILCIIQVGSRKVHMAGLAPNPVAAWMRCRWPTEILPTKFRMSFLPIRPFRVLNMGEKFASLDLQDSPELLLKNLALIPLVTNPFPGRP